MEVKGRQCYVLVPNRAEVKVKVHWSPPNVLDAMYLGALEGFGKVEDVSRDFWQAERFEGVEPTIRIIR